MDPRLRRYAIRQIGFFGISAAVMFLVAGRLEWLGGWLMVAILLGGQAGQWLIVGRKHPDLLANRFFGPVVRIQTDRGHQVADGGPYRWVRHPGYVGANLEGYTAYAERVRWRLMPHIW